MNLFRIDFAAATASNCPPLWPAESGYCVFFLFAEDCKDAAERAKTILSALPFVMLDNKAVIHDWDTTEIHTVTEDEDEESDLDDLWRELSDNARRTGLAFAFAPVSEAQPRVSRTPIVRFVIDPESAG